MRERNVISGKTYYPVGNVVGEFLLFTIQSILTGKSYELRSYQQGSTVTVTKLLRHFTFGRLKSHKGNDGKFRCLIMTVLKMSCSSTENEGKAVGTVHQNMRRESYLG